jgi:uncharacterized protein YdhG (YjbR/CyaY superfamily)
MTSSENPPAVDEYIAAFPPDTRKILQKVRQTIMKAAPAAKEGMSYNIPTFFLDGLIVHFGRFQGAPSASIRGFALPSSMRVSPPYRGEKGNHRFPLDKPIPYDLIADIVKSRLASRAGRAANVFGAGLCVRPDDGKHELRRCLLHRWKRCRDGRSTNAVLCIACARRGHPCNTWAVYYPSDQNYVALPVAER